MKYNPTRFSPAKAGNVVSEGDQETLHWLKCDRGHEYCTTNLELHLGCPFCWLEVQGKPAEKVSVLRPK